MRVALARSSDFVIFDAGVRKVLGLISCSQAALSLSVSEVASSGNAGSGQIADHGLAGRWVIEHVDDSRVVVITDRDRVDKQIRDLFIDIDEDPAGKKRRPRPAGDPPASQTIAWCVL